MNALGYQYSTLAKACHNNPATGNHNQLCSHLKVSPILYSTGWESLYPYTTDLLCLDFCHTQNAHAPQEFTQVSTPLIQEAWARALQAHPDQAFTRYTINGLRQGFRVGFNRSSALRSAMANKESAYQHPKVIKNYLDKNNTLGRLPGHFPPTLHIPELHINGFGVIPKGSQH